MMSIYVVMVRIEDLLQFNVVVEAEDDPSAREKCRQLVRQQGPGMLSQFPEERRQNAVAYIEYAAKMSNVPPEGALILVEAYRGDEGSRSTYGDTVPDTAEQAGVQFAELEEYAGPDGKPRPLQDDEEGGDLMPLVKF